MSLFSSLESGVGMCTLDPSSSCLDLDSAEVDKESCCGGPYDLVSTLELIDAPIFYLFCLGLDLD